MLTNSRMFRKWRDDLLISNEKQGAPRRIRTADNPVPKTGALSTELWVLHLDYSMAVNDISHVRLVGSIRKANFSLSCGAGGRRDWSPRRSGVAQSSRQAGAEAAQRHQRLEFLLIACAEARGNEHPKSPGFILKASPKATFENLWSGGLDILTNCPRKHILLIA